MSKRVLFLFMCLLLLSGCWDRTEIEEVGFVLGLGMDPADPELELKRKQAGSAENWSDIEHERLSFIRNTFQVAIPGNFQTQSDGAAGGQPEFFNISTTGLTNFKIRRQPSSRRSRHFSFEHLKIMLIHEQLARAGILEHLIDYYLRDHEMRRKTRIFITDSDTRDIFEMKLPMEGLMSQSIFMISDNNNRVLGMLEPADMGNVSSGVISNRSFLIPRIVKQESDIAVNGAALIHGKTNRMLGWLGIEDIEAFNWIMGDAQSGVIEVPFEDRSPFVFETFMQGTRVKYKYNADQDKDQFFINIRAEGSLSESQMHNVDISSLKMTSKFNAAVEERISKQVQELMTRMQHEYSADIFELHKQIRRLHPQRWKQIRNDWAKEDGYFSKADIQFDVEVQIRDYMLNEKLEHFKK